MAHQISYRLPVSTVVVTGIRRRTTDELAPALGRPATTETLDDVVVRVVTEADPTRWLTATLPSRMLLASYAGRFALSADGRLSSASSSTTGALGQVVGVVASLAGAAVGVVPHLGGTEEPGLAEALGARSPAEATVFGDEDPATARRAADLAAARGALQAALDQHLAAMATPGDVAAARTRLAALEAALLRTGTELAHVRERYSAWRASKQHTTAERVEIRIGAADLPTEDPLTGVGQPLPVGSEPARHARDLARRHGLGIHGVWQQPTGRSDADVDVPGGDRMVVVRVPDVLELVVTRLGPVRGGASPDVLEVARSRHLLVDSRSVHRVFALGRSWWGRRDLELSFDADGLLTGVAVGVDGTAAAAVGSPDIAGRVSSGAEAAAALVAAYSGDSATGGRPTADDAGRGEHVVRVVVESTAASPVEDRRSPAGALSLGGAPDDP